LGADLYTIGLLGDAARLAKNTPARLDDVLQRHKEVITRAGSSLRQRIKVHETKGNAGSLHDDMKRLAHRIMADMEYEISVEGEEHLAGLKPVTRDDLRLFFKECLVNISRHSGATRLKAHLMARPKQLILTISDNGRGLAREGDKDGSHTTPESLQRRADLLKAKISTSSNAMGHKEGTCVTLKLRIPWNRRQSQI
ncbi:MAG: sensor histidine kinase, partial [Akkermansiaceae bacterium]